MEFKKVKVKRTRLSIENRIRILERLENGEKVVKLAQEYNMSQSGISNIKRDKENLLRYKSLLTMCQRKLSHKRYTGVENKLDELLYKWFCEEKNKGTYLTGLMIRKNALNINKNIDGPENFKASPGFLYGFMKRYKITSLRINKMDEKNVPEQYYEEPIIM